VVLAAVAMHCGAGVERHQRVPACNAAVRWALGMTTHRLALSAGPFLLATSCARSAKQQTQHRQALLLLHLLAG